MSWELKSINYSSDSLRCISCGDMSWEGGVTVKDEADVGCIPRGDMSWEVQTLRKAVAVPDAFRAET